MVFYRLLSFFNISLIVSEKILKNMISYILSQINCDCKVNCQKFIRSKKCLQKNLFLNKIRFEQHNNIAE